MECEWGEVAEEDIGTRDGAAVRRSSLGEYMIFFSRGKFQSCDANNGGINNSQIKK